MAALKEVHDLAHPGASRTYQLLRHRYTWRAMQHDAKVYVYNCRPCQEARVRPVKVPHLNPLSIEPLFGRVHIDLFGPWKVVWSDGGSEFKGAFAELCSTYGIKQRSGAARAPNVNGAVEVVNGVIRDRLMRVLQEEEQWDRDLFRVVFSLRAEPHRSTKVSPALALYGKELVLSRTLESEGTDATEGESEGDEARKLEQLQCRNTAMTELARRIDANLVKAKERDIKNYANRTYKNQPPRPRGPRRATPTAAAHGATTGVPTRDKANVPEATTAATTVTTDDDVMMAPPTKKKVRKSLLAVTEPQSPPPQATPGTGAYGDASKDADRRDPCLTKSAVAQNHKRRWTGPATVCPCPTQADPGSADELDDPRYAHLPALGKGALV